MLSNYLEIPNDSVIGSLPCLPCSVATHWGPRVGLFITITYNHPEHLPVYHYQSPKHVRLFNFAYIYGWRWKIKSTKFFVLDKNIGRPSYSRMEHNFWKKYFRLSLIRIYFDYCKYLVVCYISIIYGSKYSMVS